jgi:hypothetical protein
MPTPTWENLDDFLDTDDNGGFATVAVFTLAVGGTRTATGIFDDAMLDGHTGEYDIAISNPRFCCKFADVADVARFDTVLIGGTTYEVSDLPLKDGTGMATIRLAPQDPQT